jgi:hypothetical protein
MTSVRDCRASVRGCRVTVCNLLVTVRDILTGEIVCRASRIVGLVSVRDDWVGKHTLAKGGGLVFADSDKINLEK